MEKGGHFVNMLIRPLRLGRFWPILYITFFEVYLSQSNRETFCCNLFQVKCYISPAKSALREFKVSMNGICLKHDPHPVYLGVTLDRTLSFKQHTTKTAGKLKSSKQPPVQAGWYIMGCQCKHSSVICSGSLLLSCRVLLLGVVKVQPHRKVDSQLNSTMRQITGCLRPTETQWLPVLANIAPLDLRRKASTDRLLSNIEAHPN